MSDPIGLQMNRQPVIRVLVVEIVGFGAEGAEKNRISAPKAPKIFRDFGIDLGVGIDLTRLTGIPVTGICDAEHKHLYHLPYYSKGSSMQGFIRKSIRAAKKKSSMWYVRMLKTV